MNSMANVRDSAKWNPFRLSVRWYSMTVLLFLDGLSAFDQVNQLVRKPVGQFQVLGAFGMTAAAVTDDYVHVVGRDIPASHIAVIIVFPVKWTDIRFSH